MAHMWEQFVFWGWAFVSLGAGAILSPICLTKLKK